MCRRFADDALSMPELERRLEKARRARTREELRALLADLPASPIIPAPAGERGVAGAKAGAKAGGRPAGRAVGQRSRGPAPAADRRPEVPTRARSQVRTSSSVALAIMGGTTRAGRWAPPENMLALAIMGGVELDFREAVLAPGSVTTINCFAFWGGIEIRVPPDVHVDTRGFPLMGGFEQTGETVSDPPEGAPVIEVNGLAIMAGVEVVVAERGERVKGSKSRRELADRRSERELEHGRDEEW